MTARYAIEIAHAFLVSTFFGPHGFECRIFCVSLSLFVDRRGSQIFPTQPRSFPSRNRQWIFS
jgi:DNA-directed RNA polymerase